MLTGGGFGSVASFSITGSALLREIGVTTAGADAVSLTPCLQMSISFDAMSLEARASLPAPRRAQAWSVHRAELARPPTPKLIAALSPPPP